MPAKDDKQSNLITVCKPCFGGLHHCTESDCECDLSLCVQLRPQAAPQGKK